MASSSQEKFIYSRWCILENTTPEQIEENLRTGDSIRGTELPPFPWVCQPPQHLHVFTSPEVLWTPSFRGSYGRGIRYNRINTFQITLVHFPLLKIIFIGLSNLWKQFQSNCMKSFQKHWWALWASRDWAGWNCYPILCRVSGVHVHGFSSLPPSVHLPFPWPCSLLAEPWHNSFVVVTYLFLVSYFKGFIF